MRITLLIRCFEFIHFVCCAVLLTDAKEAANSRVSPLINLNTSL